LRRAPAGAAIGYGGAHVLTRDSLLATVLLGYGDGLHRRASNRGSAILGGAHCPILGRVSMDLIVLDATDAPRAPAIGDRAEFFGPLLPVEHAAAAAGTSGYEFLTSLGRRVERLYRWRGAPAGWRAGDYTVQGASS
jgi:alanine racemase